MVASPRLNRGSDLPVLRDRALDAEAKRFHEIYQEHALAAGYDFSPQKWDEVSEPRRQLMLSVFRAIRDERGDGVPSLALVSKDQESADDVRAELRSVLAEAAAEFRHGRKGADLLQRIAASGYRNWPLAADLFREVVERIGERAGVGRG